MTGPQLCGVCGAAWNAGADVCPRCASGPHPTGAAVTAEAQVAAARRMLAAEHLEDSLRLLRRLLRTDPERQDAQEAVRDVRRAWHAARAKAEATRAAQRQAVEVAAPASDADPEEAGVPEQPPPIRSATPLPLVLAGALALALALFALVPRGKLPAPTPAATPTTVPDASGAEEPMADVEDALAEVVRETIEEYAAALTSGSSRRLGRLRPMLTPEERRRELRFFREAVNAATDVRVIQVAVREARAAVVVARSDFLIGSRSRSRPVVYETFEFERRGQRWTLK